MPAAPDLRLASSQGILECERTRLSQDLSLVFCHEWSFDIGCLRRDQVADAILPRGGPGNTLDREPGQLAGRRVTEE